MSAVSITRDLLASACPLPVAASGYLNIAAAAAGTPASVVAPSPPTHTGFVAEWDEMAAIIDSNARYGGGGVYGIQNGLVPSGDTTSLILSIGQGQANIDGAIPVPSGGTTYNSMPLSTAHIYVWLLQDGSITHTTSTTPPSSYCCLLCICATDGTGITSIDTSGVVYLHSGFPIRYSADAGMPTDSPAAGILVLTKTAQGTYLWNGASHLQVGIPFVAADPATPQNGEVWFDTVNLKFKVRTGGATKATAALT